MNIGKLWFLIDKLEPEYYNLLEEIGSCFLQEMIDPESFNNDGAKALPYRVVLDQIENDLGQAIMLRAQDAAIEFCLTNEYILDGITWNCIEHLLQHNSDVMTINDKKYLKALNNSYLGIYKVVSVEPNISVTLRDMIETGNQDLKVLDKNLSKIVKKDQSIATRLLTIEHKAKDSECRLSNTLIFLPKIIATQAINIIQMLTAAMNQTLLLQNIAPYEERFADNAHNRLLTKKMWAKEILEQWYLYHTNSEDYHEFFDYEGNPWQPCSLEFDIIVPVKRIAAIFDSLPNLIQSKNNSWTWIDSSGHKDLINYTKILKPTLLDSSKSPIYRGAIMHNEHNKLLYRVLGEIKIRKNKLIIDINSSQRRNIAQDFMVTNCGNSINSKDIDRKTNQSIIWD